MSCIAALEKTPADRLDYDIDYGRWLHEADTILSAVAVVSDPAVTFIVDNVDISEQVVRVWVAGGVDGEESEISVVAMTNGGRTKEACFELRIRQC